jgi:hypothetical protein
VLTVPDRRMWAQQAPSTQRCEIGSCVNACVNVNYDCNEFKKSKEKIMCVYVSSHNSKLTLFSRDVYLLYVIYKAAIRSDLGKPS